MVNCIDLGSLVEGGGKSDLLAQQTDTGPGTSEKTSIFPTEPVVVLFLFCWLSAFVVSGGSWEAIFHV
jgi:hypothetical protein